MGGTLEAQQPRRRGLDLHAAPAAPPAPTAAAHRRRARRRAPAALPAAPGALRRGQRDQHRGHARRAGAAPADRAGACRRWAWTAWRPCAGSRPDLILLDMQLPDISGLELLRHLKDDDDAGDIPVIVVSADATAGAHGAGADGRRGALRDQAAGRAAASWQIVDERAGRNWTRTSAEMRRTNAVRNCDVRIRLCITRRPDSP